MLRGVYYRDGSVLGGVCNEGLGLGETVLGSLY